MQLLRTNLPCVSDWNLVFEESEPLAAVHEAPELHEPYSPASRITLLNAATGAKTYYSATKIVAPAQKTCASPLTLPR